MCRPSGSVVPIIPQSLIGATAQLRRALVSTVSDGSLAVVGTHSYAEAGPYTISVPVTDASGQEVSDYALADVTASTVSLSQSSVTAGATNVQSGSSTTVTLTTRDASGNQLTSGDLNVAFGVGTGSTGSGTFSAVTDHGNGTYTATFTGTTAGNATITASIGGQPVTSTAPSVAVSSTSPSFAFSGVQLGNV